jgi:hypothetical protein
MKILRDLGGGIYEVECDECFHPFMFYKRTSKDGIVQCRSCSRFQKWDDVEKFADEEKKLDRFINNVRGAYNGMNTMEERK